MNKYLFILGLVGTALISACSADDLTTVLSPEEEEAIVVEAGKDSDVPITLGVGVGRAMTRTPIESDVNSLFNTPDAQYFGVSCFATGIQDGAPKIGKIPTSDENIKWSPAYFTTYPYANWLDNVPAKVASDGTKSVITFLDASTLPTETNKVYYYPFGNWYHYDFFAYYPRQAIVTTIAKSSYVDFTITGKEDLIWGKTTPPATDAFSSKYFRENPLAEIPQFTFNHLLTQLEIHLKPLEADKTELSSQDYKLTDVKLTNVYNHLRLWIACKTEDNHTMGTLEPTGSKTEIKVWKSDDTGPFNGGAEIAVVPTLPETETLVCYAMLRPQDISGMKVHVKMKKSGGEEIERDITLPSPVGGFKAGSKYEVSIELKK